RSVSPSPTSPVHAAPAPHSGPLSLHDALPICRHARHPTQVLCAVQGLSPRPLLSPASGLFRASNHRDLPVAERSQQGLVEQEATDRKSTRLNSSHVKISYAVFCLKKKKRSELW